MAIAQREAEVVWEGVLARGTGSLTSGSGVLYGSPSRGPLAPRGRRE